MTETIPRADIYMPMIMRERFPLKQKTAMTERLKRKIIMTGVPRILRTDTVQNLLLPCIQKTLRKLWGRQALAAAAEAGAWIWDPVQAVRVRTDMV